MLSCRGRTFPKWNLRGRGECGWDDRFGIIQLESKLAAVGVKEVWEDRGVRVHMCTCVWREREIERERDGRKGREGK